VKSGGFNEGKLRYTADDIRFTSKNGALYAIALGWPASGKLIVKSLASPAGSITAVALLGHTGHFEWQQTAAGLVVTLPEQKPCDHAFALKITAGDLTPVPVVIDAALQADAAGRFVLPAADAELHGPTPKYEQGGGKDQIGYWAKAEDFVSWNIHVMKPGAYAVAVTYSCAAPGSAFCVEVGAQKLAGRSASTGSWATYRTDQLGTIRFDKCGAYTVAVKPQASPPWKVIGLKAVILSPAAR
jgi:alpha-L-fucosidase